MCDTAGYEAHYRDPLDARLAAIAASLTSASRDARIHGRPVPASVQRATDDLVRWASGSGTTWTVGRQRFSFENLSV